MCCPLDHIRTQFIPTKVAIEKSGETETCCIKGFIDRSPKNFGERLIRSFQSLEWIEKIAEIVDESFHLLGVFFQKYTSPGIFENLEALHYHAHEIEHFLHATCFLGDLTRLVSGDFLEYNDEEKTKISLLRSIARIFHAVGHLFATMSYLAEKRILNVGPAETLFKIGTLLTSLGYLINIISLRKLDSDAAIQVTGLVSEVITESKIRSLAKIIHAWCVAQRLTLSDREEVLGKFIWPGKELTDHDPHDHDDKSPH